MVSEREDYASLSGHYLDNGLMFLQLGEVEKAGEFLWGGMAAALKAVAATRGIRLRTHNRVREYARGLAKESKDPGVWDDFVKAQHLHSNFYEASLERQDLEMDVDLIRRRIGLLLQMADQRTPGQ